MLPGNMSKLADHMLHSSHIVAKRGDERLTPSQICNVIDQVPVQQRVVFQFT